LLTHKQTNKQTPAKT